MADLEIIVGNYKLFVDTCSFLHEKAENFFYRQLPPIILQKESKIIVPQKVVNEVKRLQKSKKKDTRDLANKGATIIRQYMGQNLIDIRGEEGEGSADSVFQFVFTKFRTQYNLALLTQDTKLALEIIQLNNSEAVKSSKKIVAIKFNKEGKIIYWRDTGREHIEKIPKPSKKKQIPKYKLCTTPCGQTPKRIAVRNLPVTGGIIISRKFGKLNLLDVLGSGGEGSIYKTSITDVVCKVYNRDKLTDLKQKKLS